MISKDLKIASSVVGGTVGGVATLFLSVTMIMPATPVAAPTVESGTVPNGVIALTEIDTDEPVGSVVQVHRRYEDSPGWDCRYNGNRMCGAYVDSIKKWYVITFKNGKPVAVKERVDRQGRAF